MREVSTTQLPIETKIAPVFANLYKLLDNIEIIAASRDLRPHTKPTALDDVVPLFTSSTIFADSHSIALNVTARIVRPMMSMSTMYAISWTLLLKIVPLRCTPVYVVHSPWKNWRIRTISTVWKGSDSSFPTLTELHELLNVTLHNLIIFAGIPSSDIGHIRDPLLVYRKLPWSQQKGGIFWLCFHVLFPGFGVV